jgi:hypothetical protein
MPSHRAGGSYARSPTGPRLDDPSGAPLLAAAVSGELQKEHDRLAAGCKNECGDGCERERPWPPPLDESDEGRC